MLKQWLMIVTLLCGCLVPSEANANDDKPKLRIMMIVWARAGVQERVFEQELQKLGYDVEAETFAAELDRGKLADFLRTNLKPRIQKFDYIYTFGTMASLMVKRLVRNEVPQIFHAVTDPLGVGLVPSMVNPGMNIGGFSDGIPVPLQMSVARRLVPLKTLGYIFNPRESNAERDRLRAYCADFGIKVVDIRIPPEKELMDAAIEKIARGDFKIDLALLPQDSLIASHQKNILKALNQAKIPTIGTQPDYYNAGALLSIVPDYEAGGRAIANIVHEHEKGTPLAQQPVAVVSHPKLLVNTETAKHLGLQSQLRDLDESFGNIEATP